MIQRIFHPVGQGAFYSERHENHNIVYDCGSVNASKGQKVVSQSFSKEDVIDILFISHFDYDHVSLIEHLKKSVKKIRFVVMPLLYDDEKILLCNIFKSLGEKALVTLVANPKEFFGAGTHIIRVKPSSEEEINEDPQTISLNDTNQDDLQISSGTLIDIEKYSDWIFIPFNYKYKNQNNKLLNKLKKNGIDINELKNVSDYDYTKHQKIIKKTYKEVGDINENSMFLYSGPPKKKFYYTYLYQSNKDYCYFCFYPFYDIERDRVACLYTGDGNLNIVDIEKTYKKYWDLIGTIQIPHHGSILSFNNNILKNIVFICPFSVGKNNSYGHPSIKVISEILSHGSYPIYVTEDVDSIFIEIIEE